jgi:phage-related holin
MRKIYIYSKKLVIIIFYNKHLIDQLIDKESSSFHQLNLFFNQIYEGMFIISNIT